MSITDELREWASVKVPYKYGHQLTAIADRIDAEHEAKVSYWQGASYKDGYDEGFASADDWLGQHEDAMAEHGWVKLPLDADGVPIHVGDMVAATLAHGGSGQWIVDRMELTRAYDQDLWQIALDKDGACWVTPSTVRHHHAPTVEDVLFEFARFWCDEELTDIEHLQPDAAQTIAEYAAKLRLADGKE